MPQKTQLRLSAITASFGSILGSINDSLDNKAALSSIDVTDLSGSLSYLASAVRRIHGGTDFSNQSSGQFTVDVVPSSNDAYSLGGSSNGWINVHLVSGTLSSRTGTGTNVLENLSLIADSSTSLIYSASAMSTNTFTHNFQGVPLELDSLAASIGAYDGYNSDGALYNIAGTLYWGNSILNGDFRSNKQFTAITSDVTAGQVASGGGFTKLDLSNIPVTDRYKSVDVYVNGSMLVSGSLADVAAGSKDYFLDDSTASQSDLKFSFDLEKEDLLGVVYKYAVNVSQGASASGANTQVQFNDNGDFAGDTNLTWNKASSTLTLKNLSGSLTRLDDDTSYLIAGAGIGIVSGANGSITITNNGTAAAAGGADTQVQYNNSGVVGGVSGVTHTAGALQFADGKLLVDESITHTGDTDTVIDFDTDRIQLKAGNLQLFNMRNDGDAAEEGVFIGSSTAGAGGRVLPTVIPTKDRYTAWLGDSNQLLILSGGGVTSPDERFYGDMAVFVSGSKGSKGTATKGVAVFGGDMHVSGTVYLSPGDDTGPGGGPDGAPGNLVIGDMGGIHLALDQNELQAYTGTSADSALYVQGDGGAIYFHHAEAAATKVSILNTGEVGIGTVTPPVPLSIAAAAGADVTLSDGSGYLLLGDESGSNMVFDDNEIMSRNNNQMSVLAINTHYALAEADRLDSCIMIMSGNVASDASGNAWGSTDVNFFVSGSLSGRGGDKKTIASFGGDLLVSGNLHVSPSGQSHGVVLTSPDGTAYKLIVADGGTLSTVEL